MNNRSSSSTCAILRSLYLPNREGRWNDVRLLFIKYLNKRANTLKGDTSIDEMFFEKLKTVSYLN